MSKYILAVDAGSTGIRVRCIEAGIGRFRVASNRRLVSSLFIIDWLRLPDQCVVLCLYC